MDIPVLRGGGGDQAILDFFGGPVYAFFLLERRIRRAEHPSGLGSRRTEIAIRDG